VWLTVRGVRVEFVKEGLTFTGEDAPMATLLLSVMGAFAEFERALIGERQREGIALAKQRGHIGAGKKPSARSSGRRCGHGWRRGRGRRRWRGRTGSAGRRSTSICGRRNKSRVPLCSGLGKS